MDMGQILAVFNSMKNVNMSATPAAVNEEVQAELIDYLNSAHGYLADDDLKTAIATMDEAMMIASEESGYKRRINKIIDLMVSEDTHLASQFLRELIYRVSIGQVDKPATPVSGSCEKCTVNKAIRTWRGQKLCRACIADDMENSKKVSESLMDDEKPTTFVCRRCKKTFPNEDRGRNGCCDWCDQGSEDEEVNESQGEGPVGKYGAGQVDPNQVTKVKTTLKDRKKNKALKEDEFADGLSNFVHGWVDQEDKKRRAEQNRTQMEHEIVWCQEAVKKLELLLTKKPSKIKEIKQLQHQIREKEIKLAFDPSYGGEVRELPVERQALDKFETSSTEIGEAMANNGKKYESVTECDTACTEPNAAPQSTLSFSTNYDSATGRKSITVNADNEKADALTQILKLAGLMPNEYAPAVADAQAAVVGAALPPASPSDMFYGLREAFSEFPPELDDQEAERNSMYCDACGGYHGDGQCPANDDRGAQVDFACHGKCQDFTTGTVRGDRIICNTCGWAGSINENGDLDDFDVNEPDDFETMNQNEADDYMNEGIIKNVKRGAAGWDPDLDAKPKSVLARVKSSDTKFLKDVVKNCKDKTGHSPAALQYKAAIKELNKREKVNEGYYVSGMQSTGPGYATRMYVKMRVEHDGRHPIITKERKEATIFDDLGEAKSIAAQLKGFITNPKVSPESVEESNMNESLSPERKKEGLNGAAHGWVNSPNEQIAGWKALVQDADGPNNPKDMFNPVKGSDNIMTVAANKKEPKLHENAVVNTLAENLYKKFQNLDEEKQTCFRKGCGHGLKSHRYDGDNPGNPCVECDCEGWQDDRFNTKKDKKEVKKASIDEGKKKDKKNWAKLWNKTDDDGEEIKKKKEVKEGIFDTVKKAFDNPKKRIGKETNTFYKSLVKVTRYVNRMLNLELFTQEHHYKAEDEKLLNTLKYFVSDAMAVGSLGHPGNYSNPANHPAFKESGIYEKLDQVWGFANEIQKQWKLKRDYYPDYDLTELFDVIQELQKECYDMLEQATGKPLDETILKEVEGSPLNENEAKFGAYQVAFKDIERRLTDQGFVHNAEKETDCNHATHIFTRGDKEFISISKDGKWDWAYQTAEGQMLDGMGIEELYDEIFDVDVEATDFINDPVESIDSIAPIETEIDQWDPWLADEHDPMADDII